MKYLDRIHNNEKGNECYNLNDFRALKPAHHFVCESPAVAFLKCNNDNMLGVMTAVKNDETHAYLAVDMHLLGADTKLASFVSG